MAKIYRITDRIRLQIGDIVCSIAPLTYHQKADVFAMMTEAQRNNDIVKLNQAVYKTIQFSLKDIHGVEDSDGKPYQLQFDGELLSDECLDDLLRMESSGKLD